MSEEMMNSQENASTGSKTNLLIVGAIVLLLIGGAVVFSQNQNKMSDSTETAQETTQMEATIAPVGTTENEDALLTQGEMALDSTTTTGDAATGDAMMAEGEVRTIQVEAGAFYYKPTSITLKKGEKVKIVMTSKDMMHDFNVDELGVKLPITKSGETNSVEFTATQVGTFEYYCSVGQHRKNGQVGTLIVQE